MPNIVGTSEWWKKNTCQITKSIGWIMTALINQSQSIDKMLTSWSRLKLLLTSSKGKKILYQPPFHCNVMDTKPTSWNADQLMQLLTISKGENYIVSATLLLQYHLNYWAHQELQASVFPISILGWIMTVLIHQNQSIDKTLTSWSNY